MPVHASDKMTNLKRDSYQNMLILFFLNDQVLFEARLKNPLSGRFSDLFSPSLHLKHVGTGAGRSSLSTIFNTLKQSVKSNSPSFKKCA